MAKQAQKSQQQVAQAKPQFLKELSVLETVALAIDKKRRGKKESRRVVMFLKPNILPPPTGIYQSPFGEVKILSKFLQERGQWLVEVKLPPSGFPLKDHIPPSEKDSSSQGQ